MALPTPWWDGSEKAYCSKVARWIFEQILPSSDNLEALCTPWLQQFGHPFCPVLLTNVEKIQDLPLIKMLLTASLRPGAFLLKTFYVLTIIKRRGCNRDSMGLFVFCFFFDPQRFINGGISH